MNKTCFNCGESQDESLFRPKQNTCRSCRTKLHAIWVINNPEKEKQHKKRYKEKNIEKFRTNKLLCCRKGRKLHPEKHCAHVLVSRAIKKGKLIRGACNSCGSTLNIQAHHEDYSKKYDVVWLCAKCHNKIHNPLRRTRNLL